MLPQLPQVLHPVYFDNYADHRSDCSPDHTLRQHLVRRHDGHIAEQAPELEFVIEADAAAILDSGMSMGNVLVRLQNVNNFDVTYKDLNVALKLKQGGTKKDVAKFSSSDSVTIKAGERGNLVRYRACHEHHSRARSWPDVHEQRLVTAQSPWKRAHEGRMEHEVEQAESENPL